MIDFLKAFPFVSKEQYLWEWTVPQVRLATADNTHTEYLTEEQAKIVKAREAGRVFDGTNLNNDLGVPIF